MIVTTSFVSEQAYFRSRPCVLPLSSLQRVSKASLGAHPAAAAASSPLTSLLINTLPACLPPPPDPGPGGYVVNSYQVSSCNSAKGSWDLSDLAVETDASGEI